MQRRLLRFFARWFQRANHLRLWITRPLTLGVRLVLLREEAGSLQVLLVRHTYQDGWLLPGGGVERGETLEEAARREAREEAGAHVGGMHLLGIFTNFREYKSDHVAVFSTRDFRLQPGKQSLEIDACQFFPLDRLPDDLFPGHRRRLEALDQLSETPAAGKW